MRNSRKFTKSFGKVHSPPGFHRSLLVLVGIYTHSGGHIYPPRWLYIPTMLAIYGYQAGYICPPEGIDTF